jgi:hypothetical protein
MYFMYMPSRKNRKADALHKAAPAKKETGTDRWEADTDFCGQ